MNTGKKGLIGLAVMIPLAGAACAPRSASQALLPEAAAQTGDSRAGQTGTQAYSARAAETPALRDATAIQNAFAQVATAANPAVVTITTETAAPRRGQVRPGPGQRSPGSPGDPFGNPEGGRDPFEDFFRRFREFGLEPSGTAQGAGNHFHKIQAERGGGLGSGFIYRPDGHIITNAHVVSNASRVTVKLADGREFRNARVLGQDERTDVAVVKIDATNLNAVALGDSSRVRVGDWAIAMGNPFGLEHTLTVGVISAKAREVPLSVAGPGDYLQTDASINPGNSGGPLLDISGRVIGVNNAIYSRSGGNVGIGFVIPINQAREIADVLVREGRVRRAQMGVSISNLEERAAAFGLDSKINGVLIESVAPNSPGARAGLQPGDVIQSFNGETVTRSLDLQRLVSRAPIKTDARLQILRGGKTQAITVRLEELKESSAATGTETPPHKGSAPGALGLRLTPLTPDLARRYGITGGRGVAVAGVESGSPAASAGLRTGDVIEQVGQTSVSTPQEMQAAVTGILGKQTGASKSVALYVNRGGERQFVLVNVGT
ncbi:MAG: Do family serine endopeptidase [Armatimonadota bacterium]